MPEASSAAAWQALETIGCVSVEIDTHTNLRVTRVAVRLPKYSRCSNLAELDAPEAPEGKETIKGEPEEMMAWNTGRD